MNKTEKIFCVLLVVIGVIAGAVLLLHGHNFALLNPQGMIANKEKRLALITVALSLIIIVPVFCMAFWFSWKYRETNDAEYRPDWDHNWVAETTWWVVPLILISVLALITWRSTHELDPFKAIASTRKPITIQVVAMEWKWLFIYPEQHIATVNYVQFPEKTPVNFRVTADAPMNALWIPQLGGQIYAMSGMSTQLHLMADKQGNYRGSSANLSGKGFAGMKFIAHSSSQIDFDQWVSEVQKSSNHLDGDSYNQLAKPSTNNKVSYLSSADDNLYNKVMLKYTEPGSPMMSDNRGENSTSMMHMGDSH